MYCLRNITEKLEECLIGSLNKRNYSFWARSLRGILFILSIFYRVVVYLRLWAYKKELLKSITLESKVISIGNLTCGGTGKTPLVEAFARVLAKKGKKVAVLSRGYRSSSQSLFQKFVSLIALKGRKTTPKIVSDGKELLLNSFEAGDEPHMLASNLKGVVVLVDKNRVKTASYAIKEFGSEILILDDGFQYLSLKPHINILLIDSARPFHNHHVLPKGLLREPIKNICRADYIFLTKSNQRRHIKPLKKFIKNHNSKAEIIESGYKPLYFESIYEKGKRLSLSDIKGKNIAVLSAIASPESFENFLNGFECRIVYRKRYADHHNYTEQEILDFIVQAQKNSATMIITTEKDAVRIPPLKEIDIEVCFIRVEMNLINSSESIEELISRICLN